MRMYVTLSFIRSTCRLSCLAAWLSILWATLLPVSGACLTRRRMYLYWTLELTGLEPAARAFASCRARAAARPSRRSRRADRTGRRTRGAAESVERVRESGCHRTSRRPPPAPPAGDRGRGVGAWVGSCCGTRTSRGTPRAVARAPRRAAHATRDTEGRGGAHQSAISPSALHLSPKIQNE